MGQVESTLHKALLASDIKSLESVLDETFIWTYQNEDQVTRQQLLELLSSGQLKYANFETRRITIATYGDAAVVRGASTRQRSAIPNSTGTGDPAAFDAFFTLTLVNRGGAWKVVAIHSSRKVP